LLVIWVEREGRKERGKKREREGGIRGRGGVGGDERGERREGGQGEKGG
jgi:hypothetical protein